MSSDTVSTKITTRAPADTLGPSAIVAAATQGAMQPTRRHLLGRTTSGSPSLCGRRDAADCASHCTRSTASSASTAKEASRLSDSHNCRSDRWTTMTRSCTLPHVRGAAAIVMAGVLCACAPSGSDQTGSTAASSRDSSTTTAVADVADLATTTSTSAPTLATVALAETEGSIQGVIFEPHCGRMHDVITELRLGPHLPYVAKELSRSEDDHTFIGCQVYFDDDLVGASTFSITWVDEAGPWGETGESDEVPVTLTSGREAQFDPTGRAADGYVVASMTLGDDSVLWVTSTTSHLALTLLDQLDQALDKTT